MSIAGVFSRMGNAINQNMVQPIISGASRFSTFVGAGAQKVSEVWTKVKSSEGSIAAAVNKYRPLASLAAKILFPTAAEPKPQSAPSSRPGAAPSSTPGAGPEMPRDNILYSIAQKVGSLLGRISLDGSNRGSNLSVAISLAALAGLATSSKELSSTLSSVLDIGSRAINAAEEGIVPGDPEGIELQEKLGWLLDRKQEIQLFTEFFELAQMARTVASQPNAGKDAWNLAESLLNAYARSSKGKALVKDLVAAVKAKCLTSAAGKLLNASKETIDEVISQLKLLDKVLGNGTMTASLKKLESDYQSLATALENGDVSQIVAWLERFGVSK